MKNQSRKNLKLILCSALLALSMAACGPAPQKEMSVSCSDDPKCTPATSSPQTSSSSTSQSNPSEHRMDSDAEDADADSTVPEEEQAPELTPNSALSHAPRQAVEREVPSEPPLEEADLPQVPVRLP